MKTISITKSYNIKWILKEHSNYGVTECKKVVNMRTNRIIKETINGGYTVGWWIGSIFIPKNKINKYFVKLKKEYCPF